jgi:hypothetical protein
MGKVMTREQDTYEAGGESQKSGALDHRDDLHIAG